MKVLDCDSSLERPIEIFFEEPLRSRGGGPPPSRLHPVICTLPQRLHGDSSTADVLLVSEELGRLPAHRVVLTMASPFFASLLQVVCPTQHGGGG